jgi:hypothetical protein
MTKGTKTTIIILFVLVLLSLGLNGYLIWQWRTFQQQSQATIKQYQQMVSEGLAQTITDLESFEQSTIEFEIEVAQEFPVQVEIPFQESLEVPIQTTVPISQEIRTTIMLDPLQTGFVIPTDVTVPVNLDVPIDLTVPVSIDRAIPISTSVPLDMKVPIAISISETELAPYLERLRITLGDFDRSLTSEE